MLPRGVTNVGAVAAVGAAAIRVFRLERRTGASLLRHHDFELHNYLHKLCANNFTHKAHEATLRGFVKLNATYGFQLHASCFTPTPQLSI